MFWRPRDSLRVKYYTFSCYKQTNEVCLEYIDCKLQQDRYGNAFFKLNGEEMVERAYLEKRKEQKRYSWCLQMLKGLRNANNFFLDFVKK